MRTGIAMPVDLSPTEQLARELWEAHATLNQQTISFPALHCDECDEPTRRHWRSLARVALAFRSAKFP